MLSHPVRGIENFQQLVNALISARDAIKVFMEIAPLDPAGRRG
jgi:hypothetical protein